MSKYLELAQGQFDTMKEEWLDEDRHCVGGENKENYEVDGVKFEIKVEGFWEKSDWFDYTVTDEKGNKLEKGDSF